MLVLKSAARQQKNFGIQLGMLNFYEKGQAFNLERFFFFLFLDKVRNIIREKIHLGDVCAVMRNVYFLRLNFSIAFCIGKIILKLD